MSKGQFNKAMEKQPEKATEPEQGLLSAILSIGKDVGKSLIDDGIIPMLDKGRSEFAAALYTGNAYTIHGNNSQNKEHEHEHERER